jgi:hypothetical protein
MKPVQDMTLDECRDEIAESMGWAPPGDYTNGEDATYIGYWHRPEDPDDYFPTSFHPVESHLDSIAASLPPGCRWGRIGSRIAYSPEWRSEVTFQNDKYEMARVDESGEADTEILARARCCVAAWRKYKENAQ